MSLDFVVVLFVAPGVVDLVVLFVVLGAAGVVLIFGVVLGAAGVVLGILAVVVAIPRLFKGGNFLSQKPFASGI